MVHTEIAILSYKKTPKYPKMAQIRDKKDAKFRPRHVNNGLEARRVRTLAKTIMLKWLNVEFSAVSQQF